MEFSGGLRFGVMEFRGGLGFGVMEFRGRLGFGGKLEELIIGRVFLLYSFSLLPFPLFEAF